MDDVRSKPADTPSELPGDLPGDLPSARPASGRSPDLARVVGFWGASGVMVGVMVGSGIFRTPPEIAQHVSAPLLILGAWVLGGLLSLAGALTYAELATMFPQSGGLYVFLRRGYGRALAFVFGWTYMLVSKPSAAAGIAFVCAENINILLRDVLKVGGVDPRVLVTLILAGLTIMNVLGVRASTRLGVVLTAFKVLALLLIATLGAAFALGAFPGTTARDFPEAGTATKSLWLAIAPVMAAVMWTYDGWSDVGAIAGEVKEPGRLLPRIFIVNTAVITVVYVAVNAVYLWLVPLESLRGMDNVAPHVLGLLLGAAGSVAVTALIIVSTLGSSHASIMTGARVSFAQARDGLLFSFLAKVHPRFGTPATSLWVQLGLSVLATWLLGTFSKLADSFVFTMWIFYGLAGFAIFLLRWRMPEAPRAFRCPLYPVVPGLFVLSAVAMTGLAIHSDPKTTLMWVGVLLAGFPVYWVWKGRQGGAADTRP
jgi:basic amino acid/polyamine antiporter, APA family